VDGERPGPRLPEEYFRTPRSARIWNYWMGGKDNYQVDRDAGDAWLRVHPGMAELAVQSRQFLMRSVRYLAAEAGVRQFLDIGTGLPTMQNTHEVAQSVAPESKVVYVDNDPVVLAHARALLTNTTPEGVTAYVDADVHEPDVIIADARNVLNFTQPIAVMFLGILGHVADFDEVLSIVSRVMAAVPSGSYLALKDGTATSDEVVKAAGDYVTTGAVAYRFRTVKQIGRCFEGMELVEPGLVSITQWRPDRVEIGAVRPIDTYGAVGRKL
jgi:ubiquinone/menaquinone biosynthesis C-methylase UbiE